MSPNAVALPHIFLIGTSVLCLVAWGRIRLQLFASIFGSVGLILSSLNLLWRSYEAGPQVLQVGSWMAPYGITFVVDVFSSIMMVVAGLLALFVFIASPHSLSYEHKKKGFYFLANTMLLGVVAAFATGDLFNLFVCFELLLISSFVSLSLGRTKIQLEATIKYLIINFIGSICFLVSVALIYGLLGSLNMAHLAVIVQDNVLSGPEISAAALLFVAFALKAGLFPLFFWLPASYHTPPTLITAFFSGLLTKVGVYVIIRVYSLIFALPYMPSFSNILWVISVLTMVVGVLGAVGQTTIKRILSVHIVSQVGYITLAFSLYTEKALAAAIFYLVHNMLAKSNLFLIGGVAEKLLGSDDLPNGGGLFKKAPVLSVLFMISAFALAGIPPLSGFFAKLYVAQAALELNDYWALAFVFGVSVLTLFSMLKIWNEIFWKKLDRSLLPITKSEIMTSYSGIAILAISLILMGVFASDIAPLFERAAAELINPESYIQSVLGGEGL